MNLLGQAVKHKMFGTGVITDLCENKITVCFAENQKLFLFPDAIPCYLTMKNTSIQKKIESINEERERVINEKKQKIEEERTIIGVAMAKERFWGNECTDGKINCMRNTN